MAYTTIRLPKSLKNALKLLGEKGETHEDIIEMLRAHLYITTIADYGKKLYEEKSLTIKMKEQRVPVELYLVENEEGILVTQYRWMDGNEDVVIPVIHKEYEITYEDTIESAKQKFADAFETFIDTEKLVLQKASKKDKLYVAVPFEIRFWKRNTGNIGVIMRTSLNTTATPTFEQLFETTKPKST